MAKDDVETGRKPVCDEPMTGESQYQEQLKLKDDMDRDGNHATLPQSLTQHTHMGGRQYFIRAGLTPRL